MEAHYTDYHPLPRMNVDAICFHDDNVGSISCCRKLCSEGYTRLNGASEEQDVE